MTGGSEDRLPVDLSDLINNLYHTEDYFVRLPSLPHSRFEEEYHETTIDPDGSVRHFWEGILSGFITARISISQNGDLAICKELIEIAVEAECDAVKC